VVLLTLFLLQDLIVWQVHLLYEVVSVTCLVVAAEAFED
jgi:hypothetical protein